MLGMYKSALLLALCGSPNESPISNSIFALSPHIGHKKAAEYAIIIEKYSNEHGIDWRIPVALIKQESDFMINAVNYTTRDFGLGQLNYKTIQRLKVNLGRLLTDADYAISQTFVVLSEIKKYEERDAKHNRKWFTRYNSYVPSHRKKYRDKIEKHMRIIEEISTCKTKTNLQKKSGNQCLLMAQQM